MSRTSISRGRGRHLEKARIHFPEDPGARPFLEVCKFVSELFPAVDIKGEPANPALLKRSRMRSLARSFAAARLKDPDKREQSFEPMLGEISYELRVLGGEARTSGVVYDGRRLVEIYESLLEETSVNTCHIVLTDRLLSTFSEDDLRHHLRTIVPGFPSLISIPGVVEAPARPREYVIRRQTLEMIGASQFELERLRREYAGRFIDYEDDTIIEVVKGLTLQAIMFHLTLQPFCRSKGCRLFNAHWQEDLIASQVSHTGLCKRHMEEVRALGRNPRLRWL